MLYISVCTTTTNAAEVWREDFNGPLDDWTLYGYADYINETEWVRTEGNFSLADGTLKVLDDEVNIARHDSDVTVGNWSFDMFIPNDDFAAVYVEIMSNGTYGWFGATNTSFISVGYFNDPDPGNAKFIVWKWVGDDLAVISNFILDPLEGWHHIDVSRSSEGRLLFAFNGTLKANFTNNDVTSSTYLQFYCQNCSGAAIDNLVVYRPDPTTTTTTTPTSTPPPIDPVLFGLIVGTGVGVVLIAIVILRRR